jgi:hypothetical protein
VAAVSPRAEASPGGVLSGRLSRAASWISRDCLVLIVFAVVATIWSVDLRQALAADSWLMLLGGREIVAHGIPHHDALAVISHGRSWIDQQWLAQLGFYELYRIGGMGLLLRLNLIVFMLPLAVALAAARRSGASPARVLLVAVPALILTGTFVRAQIFSQLLFVPLFLLLRRESRRPSRRVLIVFPMLVLWANLHGAVVVGVALVAALGTTELLREARKPRRSTRALARAGALIVLPWLCLFATPYGLETAAYYSSTMHNPLLANYVSEWGAPTLFTLWGMLFFPFAFAAVVLVSRRPRRLEAFEIAALGITLVGGLLAVRSVIWFSYVCVILVPRLLEDVWPTKMPAVLASGERTFRVAATAVAVALFLFVFGRPLAPVSALWPDAAASKVSRVLAADPQAKVLASEEYADWLLFSAPATRGRIAFDGRWEVLTGPQLRRVMRYLLLPNPWTERLDRRYRLIVLDPKQHGQLVQTLAARPDLRRVFLNDRVVIYERVRAVAGAPQATLTS